MKKKQLNPNTVPRTGVKLGNFTLIEFLDDGKHCNIGRNSSEAADTAPECGGLFPNPEKAFRPFAVHNGSGPPASQNDHSGAP